VEVLQKYGFFIFTLILRIPLEILYRTKLGTIEGKYLRLKSLVLKFLLQKRITSKVEMLCVKLKKSRDKILNSNKCIFSLYYNDNFF
jgi:hypothetical protein